MKELSVFIDESGDFGESKDNLAYKSERTHYNESTEAKIFIEFIALIVRNRIYTKLKEELERIDETLLLIV